MSFKLCIVMTAFVCMTVQITLHQHNSFVEHQTILTGHVFHDPKSFDAQHDLAISLTGSLAVNAPAGSVRNTDFQKNGVILYHKLPTKFLTGQFFVFQGEITTDNPSGTYVATILVNKADTTQNIFQIVYLPAGQKVFQSSVEIAITGTFYITFVVTTDPNSYSYSYSTKEYQSFATNTLPSGSSQFSTTPSAVTISYQSNNVIFSWTNPTPPAKSYIITKLTITQGAKTVDVIISNNAQQMVAAYSRYMNLKAGPATAQISQATSTTESAYSQNTNFCNAGPALSFNACQHGYSYVDKQTSTFDSFNTKIAVGASINVKGTSTSPLRNQVEVLSPDLKFLSYLLDSTKKTTDTIPASTPVSTVVPFASQGVYMLEVNNDAGLAVINTPVYVGDIYPILPDYRDLRPIAASSEPTDITAQRNMILAMINSERKLFGAPAIVLDDSLNTLAQDYANRLVSENFFAHYDSQGKGPGDRAKAHGITSPVGQNLAMSRTLTECQEGLVRSNGHLRNMVDAEWTRVGLGIAKKSDGYFDLVQQFSERDFAAQPPKGTQLKDAKATIIASIMQFNPNIKNQNTKLSSALESYQKANPRPNLVSTIRSVVSGSFSYGSLSNVPAVVKSSDKIGQYIKANPKFKEVGLSLIMPADNPGYLEIVYALD